jgi:hypothetical protein
MKQVLKFLMVSVTVQSQSLTWWDEMAEPAPLIIPLTYDAQFRMTDNRGIVQIGGYSMSMNFGAEERSYQCLIGSVVVIRVFECGLPIRYGI